MAENLLATWERGPMYHGASTGWSTAATGAGALEQIRETSGFIPYGSVRPVIPAVMGSGLPFPNLAEVQFGVQGVNFSTNVPATSTTLRDFFCLIFNAQTNAHAGDLDTWGPLNAAYTAVTWVTRARSFSTIGVNLSADATASSAYFVDTAFPNSLTLNIPNNTPGSDGGFVNMDINWLGNIAARTTTVEAGTGASASTTDTAAFYRTQDCSFEMGITGSDYQAYKMVSASITFSNQGVLSPETTASGESIGVVLGPPTVSGTVTMIASIENSAGITTGPLDLVLDRYDSTTRTQAAKGMLFKFIVSAGAIFEARIPVAFATPPTYTDVGGIQHVTIPFIYAGGAALAVISALEVDTYGGVGAGLSPYYIDGGT
ncbi:MAG: hypothetical protein MUQ30_05645 [Anaerolineae bacterium]|nr:hypothetical protein [Anaerolineae bacterium]